MKTTQTKVIAIQASEVLEGDMVFADEKFHRVSIFVPSAGRMSIDLSSGRVYANHDDILLVAREVDPTQITY